MGLKNALYNQFVRKNENVRREYERYVQEHIEEHYTNRSRQWKILWKLNWHYRVKKATTPMLYWDWDQPALPDNQAAAPAPVEKVIIKEVYVPVPQEPETPKIPEPVEEKVVYDIPPKSKLKLPEAKPKVAPRYTTLSDKNKRLAPFFLAKNLLTYDVISFDIFDTLILRPFKAPEDLFVLIGEKLNIIDFLEIRTEAEKLLRKENEVKYGNHEVTLEEIYRQIERKTGLNFHVGMEAEIEAECTVTYANPYMKEVFDILKAQGKTIIAVSDMYLSSEVITRILEKNGYFVDELFVSCEYKCNKRSGQLYKQVMSKYGDRKIIHIGDNHTTDFENSQQFGLASEFYRNSYYIGRDCYKIEGMSDLVGSVYQGLVYNTLYNGLNHFNPYFEYGYVYGGLYGVGFASWIKQQCKQEGIDKILFLARDGYIYKKVFEMLGTDGIKTEYVYWSRIASIVADIEGNRYDCLKRLVNHKATSIIPTKIEEILTILNVDEQNVNLKKYGLKKDMILCKDNMIHFENALIESFDSIIRANRGRLEKIKQVFEHYIGDSKKVAIIDVGWTGSGVLSIKNLLENRFHMDVEVYCYLAASKVRNSASNITSHMNKSIQSYMFSQIDNTDLYNYHKKANNGTNSIFFELFTQACNPSFKGLSADGKHQFDIAEVENYWMIEEIHKGMAYFAKQYLAFAKEYPVLLNVPGRDAYAPYKYISSDLGFIRDYFKDFTYARGVGGGDSMQIETISDILKSVKL